MPELEAPLTFQIPPDLRERVQAFLADRAAAGSPCTIEQLCTAALDAYLRTHGQPGAHGSAVRRASLGATEDQVNLRGLVPQRIDSRGTKVEDLAGTGQPEAKGG